MGKKLKILRGTKSKEEVAYKVGITTVALMNYETGTRMPKDEIPDQVKNKKKSTHS